jgi:hypothetical protein
LTKHLRSSQPDGRTAHVPSRRPGNKLNAKLRKTSTAWPPVLRDTAIVLGFGRVCYPGSATVRRRAPHRGKRQLAGGLATNYLSEDQ